MDKRYINKLDMELSPLGFGIMRLPMDGNKISNGAFGWMDLSMEAGINYYDTGYCYQRGLSEEFIKSSLVNRYSRNTFYIADKLPVWLCNNIDDMESIFQTQLDRLGVEYIDFYLLHGLHESRWQDIYGKGVLTFLERKKKEGKIRKAGFSLHDTKDTMVSILDTYDWDFVQLQINYYDWIEQHVKDSYDYLEKKEIPCMVMEPVGGGRLSKLPDEAENLLKGTRPDDSISSWAMRYVASLPHVAVTLSGMSNEEQLIDNIATFNPIVPITANESLMIEKVVEIIRSYHSIPCTSCRYCVDECPNMIDIPRIFQQYNDCSMFDSAGSLSVEYFTFIPDGKRGDACIGCGKCSQKCPQRIRIPQTLKMIHQEAVGRLLCFDVEQFKEQRKADKDMMLVCFGAGKQGRLAQHFLRELGYEVNYFCDNSPSLWDNKVNGTTVIRPAQLKKLVHDEDTTVIITSMYIDEITLQLKELGIQAFNAK